MGIVSSKRYIELLTTEKDAIRVFDILREKNKKGSGLTAEEVSFLCNIFLEKEEKTVRKEREVR
jgi:tetraacyldisaccharide-1-P 4'-kinase